MTTTTAEPCFLEKVEPPECFFMEQVSEKAKLLKRCQALRSQRTVVYNKVRTFVIEGRKCGVTNDSDVQGSEICFSDVLNDNNAGIISS